MDGEMGRKAISVKSAKGVITRSPGNRAYDAGNNCGDVRITFFFGESRRNLLPRVAKRVTIPTNIPNIACKRDRERKRAGLQRMREKGPHLWNSAGPPDPGSVPAV
jgi:hypothetical protein